MIEALETRLLCDASSLTGVYGGTCQSTASRRVVNGAATMYINTQNARGGITGTLTLNGDQYTFSGKERNSRKFTLTLAGARAGSCAGTVKRGSFSCTQIQFADSRVSESFTVSYEHPLPTYQTSDVTVNATDNIYGAGYSTPVYADGNLPVEIDFAAASDQVLTLPSVSGTVNAGEGYGDADANGYGPPRSISFSSHGGLSGIEDDSNAFFMVGVFLTSSAPGARAPAALNFTNDENYTTLAPQIGQLFKIGVGMNASDILRQIQIPANATRLYLGFCDTNFSDNSGAVAATVSIESNA
jgi:hypothetical protein